MERDYDKIILLCNEGFARGVLYNIQLANCPNDEIENGNFSWNKTLRNQNEKTTNCKICN